MNFDEALEYLLSLGNEMLAIKLGLRNTELLLEQLGNPQLSYECVQIAGTNGKGSTAVVLDSICRSAGIRSGLYTSPHLVSITERIVIGGQELSEADFAKYATRVRHAADALISQGKLAALPTFFEHLTSIALLAFQEAGVRLAILETGLGGRLDATTVAGARTIAITPIALDHQAYLGETLSQIATEKAAIIHPRASVVVAPQSAEALDKILARCVAVNIKPAVNDWRSRIYESTTDGRYRVTFETPEAVYENVLLGVRGRHQIVNVSVATRLAELLRQRGLEISKKAIVTGIERAHHAGRLELIEGSPSLLLDGAHNPSGARALRDYLDEFVQVAITLVFGAMKDKNLAEMADVLFDRADNLILTQPDNVRAAEVSTLQEVARNVAGSPQPIATRSVDEALQKAREITLPSGMICITGSLYLVGAARAVTKIMTAKA
jgi:dihydrofolate synthase / folylpolyglutamate synthase